MIKHNQDGSINVLLVPLILAVVFLFGTLGFGFWAFAGRQDYKNNVDAKIADAVVIAKKEEATRKDKQYAEAAKNPLRTYTGPEQYGSVSLQYPKTWSAYVSAGSRGEPLDGYFNPDVVPSVNDENSAFALRLQVLEQSYNDAVSTYEGLEGVTITPYTLPKLPNIVGIKVQGQLEDEKQGIMIVLPVRDKTLQVFTQMEAFYGDFNNIILPNLTFSP